MVLGVFYAPFKDILLSRTKRRIKMDEQAIDPKAIERHKLKCLLIDIFRSSSDCYADTTKIGTKGEHLEGDVIQAMTEDVFVKTVSDIIIKVVQ